MTVMDTLIATGIATLIYTLVGFVYNIIDYCIDRQKKKDCEKLDKHEDYIIRGHIDYNNNMNKQILYKVNGDFNGNIKGENVTVILMGDGNINGNIESKDGNVVLIKGNINGDVKANKIVRPTEPTTEAKCSDCVFAENKHYISASGIFSEGYYDCSKFNKTVNEDCSACLEFKSKSKDKGVESPKLQVETLWSCYKC